MQPTSEPARMLLVVSSRVVMTMFGEMVSEYNGTTGSYNVIDVHYIIAGAWTE